MAKTFTAAQQARKEKQKQKKLLQRAKRQEHKAVVKNNSREARATKWHIIAAHEMGHACVMAVLGIPIHQVSCRPYEVNRQLVVSEEGIRELVLETRGIVVPATSRRAFAAAAVELPPSCDFETRGAGIAGALAAGFSRQEAMAGSDDDIQQMAATFSRCVSPVGRALTLTKEDVMTSKHRESFEYVLSQASEAVTTFLRQEHVAFRQLTDELRYSPNGYLRGGRVSEVLLEKGKDISGARRELIATARKIDKRIGTKQSLVSWVMRSKKKVLAGATAEFVKEMVEDNLRKRRLADRARRAKKKAASKAQLVKPKKG